MTRVPKSTSSREDADVLQNCADREMDPLVSS